jgi:hypothetical protein
MTLNRAGIALVPRDGARSGLGNRLGVAAGLGLQTTGTTDLLSRWTIIEDVVAGRTTLVPAGIIGKAAPPLKTSRRFGMTWPSLLERTARLRRDRLDRHTDLPDLAFHHDGASFQALRDTGQEPGGTDWVQIARAGRDGVIPGLRGTYDPNESYKRFDIVALNGSSFIARKDDPGECPGAGWQLHASAGRSGGRGKRGEQGPRGPQGPKGDPVSITGWEVDAASYTATPLMSNGAKGPPLELKGLFKQFINDAR